MRPPALFHLYSALCVLALPFVARHAVNKLRKGGVPVLRAHERLGNTLEQRPGGPLVWLHCRSEEEATAALPLMAHMDRSPGAPSMLVTTSTAASAAAIAGRLPSRAVHQFGPLEGHGPVNRFLDRWRPDLCVLVQSDLWPILLDQCAQRGVPVALVDARMSDQSAQGWQRFPGTAAYVLRGISMAHCQNRRTEGHLRAMGLTSARYGPALSASTDAALDRLTADLFALARLEG